MMNRLFNKLALVSVVTVTNAQSFNNLVQSMAGASEFMIGLFYITGIGLIFTGINKLKRLGHRTAFMNVDSGVSGPLILLAIGASLIFMPSFLKVMNKSIWGSADIAPMSEFPYATGQAGTLLDKIRPMITIIQFIGLVAMLRGFLILTKVTGQGAQPGTISKGFIHIFGGILAVNIVTTAKIMVNTFAVGS